MDKERRALKIVYEDTETGPFEISHSVPRYVMSPLLIFDSSFTMVIWPLLTSSESTRDPGDLGR